jgi:predicted amidohydrolase YtcJ
MREPQALLLTGGRVLTLDDAGSQASALVAADGRIRFVGSDAEARRLAPAGARAIHLRGRTAMPGFFDAHPHMDREGLRERAGVSLAGLRSVEAIVARIREVAERTPPGEWIVCLPPGEPPADCITRAGQLLEGRFPDRHDLDRAAPRHPVAIRAVWAWWATPPFPAMANTLALERLGIGDATAAPEGIEIVREPDGRPRGVFIESNRSPVLEFTLWAKLPRFGHEDRVASIARGSARYAALGTTSGYEGHGLTPELIRAYREVDAAGELKVRIRAPLSLASPAARGQDLPHMLYDAAAFCSGRGSATASRWTRAAGAPPRSRRRRTRTSSGPGSSSRATAPTNSWRSACRRSRSTCA